MRSLSFIIAAILYTWSACAQPDSKFQHWREDKDCVEWVNRTYDALTPEDRVAQCYMLAAHIDSLPEMFIVEAMVREGKAGGIIFFKGKAGNQLWWTNRLQALAQVPLLIGEDAEWGLGMRLDSVPSFPHQLTLGAISDNSLIRRMGAEIGRECKRIGVNIDFAPVVDINSNPLNPVINDRSFGEDKMKVAIKGIEYMDGLQGAGVLACAKHFPGHGDTDKDSHKTLPEVNKSLEQLQQFEFYPFRAMIAAGVGCMMVAHLSIPALDTTEHITTSLSKKVVTNLLKGTLGFQGLVFSDALNMRGVSSYYKKSTIDSIAFMAGTDMLEYSEDPECGQEKILSALKDTTLADTILEEHVKKILAYKYLLGLKKWKPIESENLSEDLNSDSALALRRLLYEQAITIAANENNLLPMRDPGAKKTASVSIDIKGFSQFQKGAAEFAALDVFNAPNESNDTLLPLLDTLSTYERVIIDLHGMSKLASANFGINPNSIDFIKKLSEKTEVVLIVFGSPYSLKFFDSIPVVVEAYEDNEATNTAAANVLYGGLPASGKLPVTACDKFKAGTGFKSDETLRLKLSTPEEVHMKTEDLRDMDDVVLNGMLARAYPGCELMVVKDGKVIWDKAYGSQVYEDPRIKVRSTDLYDLASITKIAATTIAVMKLYDEGRIDISKNVGDYLQLDDSATIKSLKISDVMAHQAGLRAFFEFYKPTLSMYACYYRRNANDTFCLMVCDSMCMRRDYADSMWYMMSHGAIKPDQGYLYSDVDFYIMQKIVEKVSGMPLDKYVYEKLYRPMGLTRIGFKPLGRFPKSCIVPTERDTSFRHELVRGYVHDPGSAMYGGVAGHAGVFSDAFDLAQLMQMLLNKGKYNGRQILLPSSVERFTMRNSSKSRRGLGFDKPEPDPAKQSPTYDKVPLSVFGHTGFTGTSVWSDPDNNLTFIFLSNRVYPSADNPKLVKMNIRTELQKIVYKALPKK